jgi:hypothetical protein
MRPLTRFRNPHDHFVHHVVVSNLTLSADRAERQTLPPLEGELAEIERKLKRACTWRHCGGAGLRRYLTLNFLA